LENKLKEKEFNN